MFRKLKLYNNNKMAAIELFYYYYFLVWIILKRTKKNPKRKCLQVEVKHIWELLMDQRDFNGFFFNYLMEKVFPLTKQKQKSPCILLLFLLLFKNISAQMYVSTTTAS